MPGYFASAFDHQDVWDSLVPIDLGGRTIPGLCPEHLILLLCVHGAKHAFERLGWICDIASCLVAFPNLRWPDVLAASTRAGTMRQLLQGLRIAEDLLGVSIPASLPEDPAVEKLVLLVRKRVMEAAPPISESELIPFCLRLFESPRNRARYLLGHFAPSRAEYQILPASQACISCITSSVHCATDREVYDSLKPVRTLFSAWCDERLSGPCGGSHLDDLYSFAPATT